MAKKILIIDDYKEVVEPKTTTTTRKTEVTKKPSDFDKIRPYLKNKLNKRAILNLLKVMRSYQEEKVYTTLDTNNRFRQIDQNLNLSQTKFKKFKAVYKVLEDAHLIEFIKASTHEFVITDKQKVILYLSYIQKR